MATRKKTAAAPAPEPVVEPPAEEVDEPARLWEQPNRQCLGLDPVDASLNPDPDPDPTPPNVAIVVPASTDVPVGVATEYTTQLVNDSDTAVPDATDTLLLVRDDGTALDAGDVVYETDDSGSWVVGSLTADANGLTATEHLPIPAHLDATSKVRITLTLPEGTVVNGTSTIAADDSTLATTDYAFTVVAAPEA